MNWKAFEGLSVTDTAILTSGACHKKCKVPLNLMKLFQACRSSKMSMHSFPETFIQIPPLDAYRACWSKCWVCCNRFNELTLHKLQLMCSPIMLSLYIFVVFRPLSCCNGTWALSLQLGLQDTIAATNCCSYDLLQLVWLHTDATVKFSCRC